MLDHVPCKSKTLQILSKWSHSYTWRQGLKTEKVQFVKSPLEGVGHWIKLKVEGSQIDLTKISPDLIQTVSLKSSICKLKISKSKIHQPSGGFTDSVLQKILEDSRKNKTSGLIYAWSPRMNLSVKGMHEARDITKKLNINFHLVHDSNILRSEEILSQVKKYKSKKNNSIELIERGVGVHFPSIIFYKNGILDDHPRPGYDEPIRLTKLLTKKKKGQ